MSSNTKIVVLRSKELVYALVLFVVSVLIIMAAVSIFIPSKDSASQAPAQSADEAPEQLPSQVPSQTVPNTAPSSGTSNGTSNGSSNGSSISSPNRTTNSSGNATSNGNANAISGENPSGASGKTTNGSSSGTSTKTTGGSTNAPSNATTNKTTGGSSNGSLNGSSNSGSNGSSNGNSATGSAATQHAYVPGIYSSTLLLGNANVEVQIAVDSDHINSITLTNLDESITTLYPLMSPTLTELASVILTEQSIDNISYGSENRYTSMLLMQAISAALDKAAASENADRPEGIY